jgi:nitrite reductase/ring-hydroxylating ferredoxin subunit
MRGWPYENFPTGWFQVAWSDEVAPGAVLPMRYFARDLVCARTEAGEVRVFDAFCPHLGAHLGHGGTLEGDCLVCPFHGWKFDGDGHNVEIPYADRPNRAKKLVGWPVREANGAVVVWHDALGRDPLWEPSDLPEWGRADYWSSPALRKRHERVRLMPQWVAENLVDPAHQKFVHGAHDPTVITRFEVEGPMFRIFNLVELGAGKESTWLTPDGARESEMNTEAWGVGIILGRFPDQDGAIHYQAMTPIDHEYSELNMALLIPRSGVEEVDGEARPDRRTARRFDFLVSQLEADFVIWEHMRYTVKAPLTRTEAGPYGSFRRWARQFYPEADGGDWTPRTGGELAGTARGRA